MEHKTMLDIELNTSFTFSPLTRMISYLQWGLILTSFTLNVGYFAYLTTTIGLILIYLGLRMAKEANAYFKLAYQCSFAQLIFRIIILSLLTTPYFKTVDSFSLAILLLEAIEVYLIMLGLKEILKDSLPTTCFKFYLACVCVGFIDLFVKNSWINTFTIMLYVLFLGCMIYLLNLIKKACDKNYTLVQLSLVNYNPLKVFLIFILCVDVAVGASFYLTTSFQYKTSSSSFNLDSQPDQVIENAYTVIDNKASLMNDPLNIQGLSLKYSYKVYQNEEIDIHVLDYEWFNVPNYTYQSIVTYHFYDSNSQNKPSELKYNFIYNDSQSYENKRIDNTFYTYVDPSNPSLKGKLVFYCDHQNQDWIFHDLTFNLRHGFHLLYEENIPDGIRLHIEIENREVKQIDGMRS